MNAARARPATTRARLLAAAVVLLALPAVGAAADYYCVPLETMVRTDFARVLCAEPIDTRFGYPKDPPASANQVKYFAVPLTDQAWADRFIRVADLAQVSGLTLRLKYTPGDFSGEAFGCLRGNCRTPWEVTLVKVPPVWPNTIIFLSGFEAVFGGGAPEN